MISTYTIYELFGIRLGKKPKSERTKNGSFSPEQIRLRAKKVRDEKIKAELKASKRPGLSAEQIYNNFAPRKGPDVNAYSEPGVKFKD